MSETQNYTFKSVEELTFTDDYMFGAVMRHEEICKGVLERLLHIKIEHISYPELQKGLKPYYTSKGVRLDVYVKDSDRVFNVELQNKKYDTLGKRTRYYQAMMDIDQLMRGDDYSKLKESYVIFICTHIPFEENMPVYTFESICLEDKNIKLDDKVHKVIYNSSDYEKLKDTDRELYSFLRFVDKNSASDDFTDEISALVEEIKLQEEFKTRYMAVNLHERDIRVEAKREGITEGIAQGAHDKAIEAASNLLKMGLGTIEQIAQAQGLSVEEVRALQSESAQLQETKLLQK